MNDEIPGLPVPPERGLPEEARARVRAEVLAEVDAAGNGPLPSRWRWAAPAAVAAAVLVIVLGGAVVIGRGAGDDGSAPPVGGSASTSMAATTADTSPSPGGSTSASPSHGHGDCASMDPLADPSALLRQEQRSYRELLPKVQAYRDILAQHLDPTGEHLDPKATNEQTGGTSGCGVGSLGTKVGWSTAGQGGLGMVEVDVSRSWTDSQIRLAHDGWRTAHVAIPDVTEVRTVKYDGGFAVAVTRSDGLTVAIDANELFGNNSLEGIAGFPFSPDDLIATAADPAFKLPD